MKFIYDRETDSLYIHLSDRPGADAHMISNEIVLDVDAEGRTGGLDI